MPKTRTWSHELEVVGLGFRMTKEKRVALAELVNTRGSIPGCRLEREPDNPKDPNAIMVKMPPRVMHGMHFGYLHCESAELLAPKLDAGTLAVKSVVLHTLDNVSQQYQATATIVVRFVDKPAEG